MSNLKTEVQKLSVSLFDHDLTFEKVQAAPTQDEENALLEFVIFIKTNFFPGGKFKMNWWSILTNPGIVKVLAKALPAIVKAVGRWIGL